MGLFSKGEWKPVRTIWPYPDGWGVYNAKRRTMLETGLATKAEAKAICDTENKRAREAASHSSPKRT